MGEVSGDALAASLIQALKNIYPEISCRGVAGPQLIQTGCQALFPMERLTVMGFIEPLFRLPDLFWMRHKIIQHFIKNPPDVMIGVDSPDFNLGLEKKLKQAKIKTVHYVSPTVWAWRQGRIHTIRESVDLMLALYPFEAKFYEDHSVKVCFTGHPFADQIPLNIDTAAAKESLGFSHNQILFALLPGSRQSELKALAKIYIETAKWCYQQRSDLIFLVPLVSKQHQLQFDALCLQLAPEVPIQTSVGNARSIMAAADCVLVTSGTATLEVMLHKKPMAVAYRMNPLTYQLAKRLVKVPYISQPNLLANEELVPEFIQDAVSSQNLGKALLLQLEEKNIHYYQKRCQDIHLELRCNASHKAAMAIAELLEK